MTRYLRLLRVVTALAAVVSSVGALAAYFVGNDCWPFVVVTIACLVSSSWLVAAALDASDHDIQYARAHRCDRSSHSTDRFLRAYRAFNRNPRDPSPLQRGTFRQ